MTMEETKYWRNYSLQKRKEALLKVGNESVQLEHAGAMLMQRDKEKALEGEPISLNKIDDAK